MSINRSTFLWSVFAISGLVMAWLSLGINCAHFDIEGMCRDISSNVSGENVSNFSLTNCFRLADLSKSICGKIWTVSWFGTIFGLTAACIGVNQSIIKYIDQSWENENT